MLRGQCGPIAYVQVAPVPDAMGDDVPDPGEAALAQPFVCERSIRGAKARKCRDGLLRLPIPFPVGRGGTFHGDAADAHSSLIALIKGFASRNGRSRVERVDEPQRVPEPVEAPVLRRRDMRRPVGSEEFVA